MPNGDTEQAVPLVAGVAEEDTGLAVLNLSNSAAILTGHAASDSLPFWQNHWSRRVIIAADAISVASMSCVGPLHGPKIPAIVLHEHLHRADSFVKKLKGDRFRDLASAFAHEPDR